MMARARRAHPKAEYTTATDPLPKVRDQSVRCLQGESIHELLGPASWLVKVDSAMWAKVLRCNRPNSKRSKRRVTPRTLNEPIEIDARSDECNRWNCDKPRPSRIR